MSSGGGDIPKEREMRFAPYLEAAHKQFINDEGEDIPTISMTSAFNEAVGQSVYSDYTAIEPKEGFFGYKDDGTTLWQLKNFPSLFDMFGKFMAGLDVCELWSKVATNITYGSELNDSISAQAALLQDDIDTNVLPKFYAGMRNINAVQSTAFIVGKSIIQDGYVKAINKYAGDLRIKGLDWSIQVWSKHLTWNQAVIQVYSELHKLYYVSELDVDGRNKEFAAKDALWDLNLFNYASAMLGALSGTPGVASGGGNEPSDVQRALGGAMSGAAAGGMMASAAGMSGPWGAAIGGAIGLAGSLL